MNYRITLKLLCLWLLIFSSCICSCRKADVFVYVFPNGFRGTFILKGAQPDGLEVKSHNGIRAFVVPPSGIIKLRGPVPTYEWHSPRAEYENGESIPILNGDHPLPNATIALRRVGSRHNAEEWFVVGTYDDARRAQEQMVKGS